MVDGGLAPPSELLDAYRANPPMVTIAYRLSPIAYRLTVAGIPHAGKLYGPARGKAERVSALG